MRVRIYLDLHAAHKRDWESEGRNVEGSGVGPACCLSLAIWEGLTPRPALEMGPDWYKSVQVAPPSCPGSSQGAFVVILGPQWTEVKLFALMCGVLSSL